MRGPAGFLAYYAVVVFYFPMLPMPRVIAGGKTPRFTGTFDPDGAPVVEVPDGYLLTADEVFHEAGHIFEAILERNIAATVILSLYWSFRGFSGTWMDAQATSARQTDDNAAWKWDPHESFAEAFSRGIVGALVPPEKTLDYGRTLDPRDARAFFLWLALAIGGASVAITIVGPSQISVEGIAAYLAEFSGAPRGHASRLALVADIFGIRAEVLLAQQIHETHYYDFPLCGQTPFNGCPEFNNYCGIKTSDSTAIAKFGTPLLGCIAQAVHLLWYAVPDHVNAFCSQAFDPRHFGTMHKNNCMTVADLSGKWAPSVTDPAKGTIGYGDRVEMKIADILAFDQRRRELLAF